jgi:hypothetical protein
MLYEVTYQVAGQQQTDRVDAPDAAAAAATVRDLHGRSSQMFELILVQLVDNGASSSQSDRGRGEAESGQ